MHSLAGCRGEQMPPAQGSLLNGMTDPRRGQPGGRYIRVVCGWRVMRCLPIFIVVTFLIILSSSRVRAGDVYLWTDGGGVAHITDDPCSLPPPGGDVERIRYRDRGGTRVDNPCRAKDGIYKRERKRGMEVMRSPTRIMDSRKSGTARDGRSCFGGREKHMIAQKNGWKGSGGAMSAKTHGPTGTDISVPWRNLPKRERRCAS